MNPYCLWNDNFLTLELEHRLSEKQDLGQEAAKSSLQTCAVLGMKHPYCSVVEIHDHTAVTVKMSVLSVKWVSLMVQYVVKYSLFQYGSCFPMTSANETEI